MAIYARETRVSAPFEEVWRFHSTVDGLLALTPEWMGLRVEGTYGPDERPDPEILEAGSIVRLSVRPFGVGPRQSWTSRIVEREEGSGTAFFRDVMIGGPFETWDHTHSFFADDGGTIVRDHLEYEVIAGPGGPAVDGLARGPLSATFRYRHRRMRELLGRA